MPFCEVNKASIYYEAIGEGIPMVMIHGFGIDHRLMKGCMEPIFDENSGVRRIYFDLPGMGKTKDYGEIQHADDMLETVLDFIQKMIPNHPFLLAGESYGGYLARGVIAKQPEHIGGLALLCPVIKPKKQERALPTKTILHRDDDLMNRLTEKEKQAFRSESVVLDEQNWNRFRDEIYKGLNIADEGFLGKIVQNYSLSFDVDEGIFDKPSVFILGKQDSTVGYKDAFQLLDHYPRASFAVLDRAGHYLQIEQAGLFNNLMGEWLDRAMNEWVF
ncbi:alpha/beta fold hydrolase [Ornithinibacillus sp. L9]|uniref:Alpha/beta fold hydrolase n=1 Tax=Ornithinibacillus caprae TaxID=2678566 RepID=A0A6N8FDZ4_9BACI|nr:alpha/beta hydrolase [Ornithinibacillus caprae]MUK87750.1 alpha/beta fold hydrolase [Ornithinibacillus caprae]